MLQISTKTLVDYKKVEIDGHVYTIRLKASAGDQLTISQLMRELTVLSEKEKAKRLTKADEERVSQIEEEIIKVTSRAFDDGGDGSKSIELVKSLDEDQMQALMKMLQDEPKPATEETKTA